jgi:hypothetical protein
MVSDKSNSRKKKKNRKHYRKHVSEKQGSFIEGAIAI